MSLVQDDPSQQLANPDNGQCNTHPLTDRRRATRLRQKFVTQMTPWAAGHASVPFEVVIADISEVGVGIIHDKPIELGLRHLLTVPRDGGKAMTQEYLVVRCEFRHDGSYSIGLERSIARDSVDLPVKRRVVSERVKLLFLLFGLFGLIIATFAPL
jgi:hypothetical protein